MPSLIRRCATLALSLCCAATHAADPVDMLDIPGGSFLMGSCAGDGCANPDPKANDNEMPQRRVQVAPFQMGRTEVTLGQYKTFLAEAGRTDLVNDRFLEYNRRGNQVPVVAVSWIDAQAYITWLNQHHGDGWRLPTEAEWEYACRAGGQHRYCGSDDVGAVAWYTSNSGPGNSPLRLAQPVAGKRPNAFGLYDMSGNAMEWVQDCWHDSYRNAPADGSARNAPCDDNSPFVARTYRGGSWDTYDFVVRAAWRSHAFPASQYDTLGFRLARTPVDSRSAP